MKKHLKLLTYYAILYVINERVNDNY